MPSALHLIEQPSALTGLSVSFHPFSTRALWDPCYGDFNRATMQASREDRTAKLERSSQLMRAQLAQLEQAPSVSWPSPLTPLQKCAHHAAQRASAGIPSLGQVLFSWVVLKSFLRHLAWDCTPAQLSSPHVNSW